MTAALLHVVASGMVTPLGYDAPSSLGALRAGVSALRASGWADPESGSPLRAAAIDLPHGWEDLSKLADLAATAIGECLRALPGDIHAFEVPWLIGIAEPDRPGRFAGLDSTLLDEVALRLAVRRHSDSATFAADQVGGFLALQHALELLRAGRARRVVVAGVDTFLCDKTIASLLGRRRLVTPRNINGFFPGEAATAVVVSLHEEATSVAIDGWGLGNEAATIEGTRPLRGDGLQHAVSQALTMARTSMSGIDFRMTDLSGEHYKFKEAMIVALRLDRATRDEPLDLWHPVEYLGEIGAAMLPCLLAWSRHAFAHGYAPGPRVLCHLGNDAGQRAALVLRTASTTSQEIPV